MEDAVRIFRLVATEFDALNDETVEAWLNLTAPLISKKVFGKLYDCLLYTSDAADESVPV